MGLRVGGLRGGGLRGEGLRGGEAGRAVVLLPQSRDSELRMAGGTRLIRRSHAVSETGGVSWGGQ